MTNDTLLKAKELAKEIEDLDNFIYAAKRNRFLGIIKKPLEQARELTIRTSDYGQPYIYYEVNDEKIRDKIIQLLEEKRNEMQKEFDNL